MNKPKATIRASSFADLLDCPHRWEAKHLLGMEGRSSGIAHLGTAIHAGTALFDKGEGKVADAINEARRVVAHPEREVEWDSTELSKAEADKSAARVVMHYCSDVAPVITRGVEWLAVERTFTPVTIDVDGVELTLTGSTDRLFRERESNAKGVFDLKTGKNVISSDGRVKVGKHMAQLATYALLAELGDGERYEAAPGIIAISTNPNKPAVKVAPAPMARDALLGTEGAPGVLQMAAQMIRSGLFPPNPNSILCSRKFCPRHATCRFSDWQ